MKKKTQRQLADEAWLRNQQLELPPEAPQAHRLERYEVAPAVCPGCGKAMTPRSGWTLIFGDILQCGKCGNSIEVPRAEFERVGAAIHAAHPHGDGYVPPPKPSGPRVRGAG